MIDESSNHSQKRGPRVALLGIFLLIFTACSGSAALGAPVAAPTLASTLSITPPTQPTVTPTPPAPGPLLLMGIASSLDAKGRLVNRTFTFPQTEPQVTAVVQVGKVGSATLAITWYQETDSGDQKLFEHQVPVGDYDRAFSIGKNPGGVLAAGTYRVVATLTGASIPYAGAFPLLIASQTKGVGIFPGAGTLTAQTEETEFDVAPPKGAAPSAGAPAPQGQPPVAGSSGKMGSPAPPSAPSSAGCLIDLFNFDGSNVSDTADRIDINLESTCPGFVTLTATVNGPPVEVGTFLGEGRVFFRVDPCDLPGGKDLPGTKVQFDAGPQTFGMVFDKEGSPQKTPSPFVITLADDNLGPRTLLDTSPAHGTKVKAGDTINITVTAQERRRNGPWQTGVRAIHVRETQVGGGQEFFTWSNPQNLPQPCAAKTWEHTEHTTYTVPKNPPPIIEICGSAEDWNQYGAETCSRYPTGKVWMGTIHSKDSVVYHGPNFTSPTYSGTEDGKLVLSESADGTIAGHGQVTVTGCRVNQGIPPTSISFDVTGKNNGKQLELQIMPPVNVVPKGAGTCGFGLGWAKDPISSAPFAIIPITAPGQAQGRWHGENAMDRSTTNSTVDYEFDLTAQ